MKHEVDELGLDARERRILKMRRAGMTLKAIGKKFGITRERVRQLEHGAKAKVLQAI